MGNENIEIRQNAEKLAEGMAASESSSAQIRFDPEKYPFIVERGVGPGYKFNTTVELYDVTGLFAWQVRVYFNNTLLNATNAYYHPEEPIHNVNYVTVDPVIKNDYNSTHGYIQFGISAVYPDYVNVTAEDYPEGVGICFLEFEVLLSPSNLNDFQCDLVLKNDYTYLLWKDGGTEISCEKLNGWYCLDDAAVVPTEYATIQEAINALDDAITKPYKNTVLVYNGTYYENIIINKTAWIIGESADIVVINGTGETVISLNEADDIIIEGLTVTYGKSGVYLYNAEGVTIHDCIITKNIEHGIFAYTNKSEKNINRLTLYECDISANGANGIYAYATPGSISYWEIFSNNISANGANGIYAYAPSAWSYCDHWMVSYNNITANNGYGINTFTHHGNSYCDHWSVKGNNIKLNKKGGIYAYTYNARRWGWQICDNYITENKGHAIEFYGYLKGIPDSCPWTILGNIITNNEGSGIYTHLHSVAIDHVTLTVSNNNITDNKEYGVYAYDKAWVITNNSITSNQFGIYLLGSNHILRGNRVNNNTYNFGVTGSCIHEVDSSNTVNGKPIYYWVNRRSGRIPADAGYIALVDSTDISARDCNLTRNVQGILLVRAANINLENIYLRSNVYGIFIQGSSNCTISGNTLEENEYGIYLLGSSNNTIYHNNFIQNNQQIVIADSAVNYWDNDYPSGGNYWSEYTGPDECRGLYQNETGSDGIVDTNYTINQNNIDRYPLSAPWSSPINILLPGNTTYRGINITVCAPYQAFNLTFTLGFNASWIGYSLDGHANVTITGNVTLTHLSYGTHYVIVYANDTFGNMYRSAKVYFTITFLTDLNYDGTVDVKDLAMTCYAYGSVPGDPRWKCKLDVNRDGIVDIEDIAMVATDYGKTW